MLKVYHYSGCSSCKSAIKFLKEHSIEASLVDIVAHPPSRAELSRMLKIHNSELRKLFNTSGERYRELNLKDKLAHLTSEEALSLLEKEGKLIKRPFLISEKVGLVGFKTEEWKKSLL